MRWSEARQGRVFVVRLEDGDVLHESLESLCVEMGVERGYVMALGGAADASGIVSGPERDDAIPAVGVHIHIDGAHELLAVGTVFPDDDGTPTLHMHASLGRRGESLTGCVRPGVSTWHIIEVVLVELLDNGAMRSPDPLGFQLLDP